MTDYGAIIPGLLHDAKRRGIKNDESFRQMIVKVMCKGSSFTDPHHAASVRASAERTADEIISNYQYMLPWSADYIAPVKAQRKNPLEKYSDSQLIDELSSRGYYVGLKEG